MLVGASTI